MSRIDENLLRKRSEHNEGEIGTLEELSLHQEDLEKLEYLQHWCKDLKILLLHSNLIPKIENIGKLKKLEYINFSLNNIEKIENLEGCESLQKVDFTLNFIGDLTSVESLKANVFLETLYLTGNPCTDYTGYREFVIATLTQLKELDGREITRTERILALRKIDKLKKDIIQQQNKYREKREAQRKEYKNGIIEDDFGLEKIEEYWSEKSENTPEVRREIAINSRKAREKGKKEVKIEKRAVRLFDKDGKPLNVNQAKIPFTLTEDEYNNQFILDVAVYKYLDTNLLDVDVEAKYVKVKIKEKFFQITLMEEISPDKSTAQRSQTTGHLVITMPKANEFIRPKLMKNTKKEFEHQPAKNEYLEFEEKEDMDFSKIVERSDIKRKNEPTDQDIDESEIPPLEDINE